MPNLSDHDLRQMDEAWQRHQPEETVRGLLARALDDLRLARDRMNQTPANSSRPSGSMAPWQRDSGAADGGAQDEELPDEQSLPEDQGRASPPAEPAAEPSQQPDTQCTAARVQTPGRLPGRAGRRIGAPGFGRQQKLLPSRIEEQRPSCCAACLASLPSDAPAQAWSGWDTLELVTLNAATSADPPQELGVRIQVTRHLLMQQRCCCGHTTQARAMRADEDPLWPGVDISQQRLLGPRLAATVVYLCVRMRLPRRKVSELLFELLGVQLSPALIDQTVHQSARSVPPLEDQLAQQLEQAVLVHADETSWAEAGQSLWLWVLCCCHTVLYMIGSRTKEMLDNALSTAFSGELMTDGYAAYRSRLQRLRCWAHLRRKLKGVAESTDRCAAQAGISMLQCFDALMNAVFEARNRLAQPPPSVTHAQQLEQLRQFCKQHRDSAHKALRDLAREFLKDWDVIVRPLAEPRFPLTNNAAERQLRHYVIARRISYGTRTPVGSHSIALLASVIDTCRLRCASPTDLLARAIHSARIGQPPPHLPPIPTALPNENPYPLAA